MKFKFRHADKIVGLFAIIALALLMLIAVFAGVNKKWFVKKIHFTSQFTSAEGLKVGMGVNLRGFEIGRVKTITLNTENQVDINFYIYETYHDRVRPDSVLALPSGLLGTGGALSFYPGLSEGDILPDGTYIPSTQTKEGKLLVKTRKVDRPDSGDAITDILDRLPDILDSLDGTVNSIGDLADAAEAGIRGQGDDSLASTVRNIESVTFGLDGTIRDVNEITASLATLAGELEDPTGLVPTLLDPSGSLDTLLNDNDVLWEHIVSILEEVDGAVSGINELSTSLAGVSPQLALTLDELIKSLAEAQKVMEGLQNNPLLKKGISPDSSLDSPGTDYRVEEF